MSGNKEDPRVIRTKRALREALMRLVEQKPFSRVTISEITEEAGLDRTTFYLHFQGIHELMGELAESLFKELRSEIYNDQSSDFSQRPEEIEGYVEVVFNHLEKYSHFYQRVLGKQGDPYFNELFQLMLSELLFEPIASHFTGSNEVSSEMILRFYCSGFTGVAIWWLEKGLQIEAKTAARQIARDILPGYLKWVTP